MVTTTTKGGGTKKHGRNLAKCRLYAGRGSRFRHKLARVTKSQGVKAAAVYNRGPRHAKRYRMRHAEKGYS